MAQLTIGGNPANTIGELPAKGTKAPDFTLTKTDLTDMSLKDVAGKKIILNIFPSVDTPVCSASVRKFNEVIGNFPNAVVLCVSRDLPFAHARFCAAEGLKNVISVSELRDLSFGDAYGVRLIDSGLSGLLARAVIVIGEDGKIKYTNLISELKNEPHYDEVLEVLKTDDKGNVDVCTHTETAEHSRPLDADGPCDDGRAG